MKRKCEIGNLKNYHAVFRNPKNPKRWYLISLPVFRIFFGLMTLFLFQNCSEPSIGCRDIVATNYNVTADEDCEDSCCTYPLLKIQFSQKIQQNLQGVDTIVNFLYNDFYNLPNAPLDTFSFQKIQCYLSDFRLVDANGVERKVEDEITLSYADNAAEAITVIDDIFMFKANSSSAFTIGTFRNPGTYETLKFKVGLANNILITDVMNAPISELEILSDSLNYREGIGYISQNYVYFNEPSAVDSTIVFREEAVEISLTTSPFVVVEGYDTTLRMTVRYDEWLKNLSMKTVSAQDFENTIVSNLPNVFNLDSLEYN